MSLMSYLLPLLVSGFTGWLVVWVLIKFMFRPVKPLNFAGFKLQGMIPASKPAFTEKLARLAKEELFDRANLEDTLTHPDNFNKLKPEIESHIDQFLRERLKDTFPMLAMLIGDKTISQLKTAFLLELETLFPILIKSYINNLERDNSAETVLAEKINEIPVEKVEKMFYAAAGRHLLKLQAAGALIGFVMGFLHIFINSKLFY